MVTRCIVIVVLSVFLALCLSVLVVAIKELIDRATGRSQRRGW